MLFCLALMFCATAQNKTKVYGNLSIENVNIRVSNTTLGTTTNTKGYYELPLNRDNKPVKLHYSCIGYQDTVVSLSTQQLQRDSVNISFRMRKQNYNLQEVTVSAKHKLYGEKYFFMDFEVFDHTICILAACPNKKRFCLIMADESLRGFDTISIPVHIRPEYVMRDCMDNCQLVAKDSVYEIGLSTKPHRFFAAERSFFFRTMSDCLFVTDEHIYFKEKAIEGYLTSIYRIDRVRQTTQPVLVSDMTGNLEDIMDDLKFNARYPVQHGAPLGIYIKFIKTFWFPPSDVALLKASDTLVYLDHNHGLCYRYDLDLNKIDSCNIHYPFLEGWKHTLYQDFVKNKFYTIIKDQLFEIDPASGNIKAKTKLNPNLYSKTVIHDGQLLLLKKAHDSSGEIKTFIEIREL